MRRWWYVALLVVAACRGLERDDYWPHGEDVVMVPEHYELGTLPMAALPPIAKEIDYGTLAAPETVIHDLVDDVYLVSNIKGDANATDDNGYISKISPMGQAIDPYFIDGRSADVTLHAPRGMVIGGDTLYVADEGAIRLFDRRTGEPKGSWEVPDSHFLNGLAIDANGRVLATDTGIAILPKGPVKVGPYRILAFTADGTQTVIAEGDDLHGPNGIVAGPAGIFFVQFMGDVKGIVEIEEDGTLRLVGTLPFGALDGLVLLPDGSMLVSSWLANGVFRFVAGQPAKEVVQGLLTPAGISYDVFRGRVLIPALAAHKLRFEPWAPPASQLKTMSERWGY